MLRSRSFTLRIVVVVVAALVCFILLASVALATPQAIVYTVDRDDDANGLPCTDAANDCSLRSAVTLANSDGADTDILFTTGVHTITLGTELDLTASGTWIGANAGRTVFINANNSAQAFYITGSDVTLNNLYIYGSHSGTSNIWIGGSAQRVTLSNNYIGGYPGPGGGVECTASLNSYSGIYINSTGAIAAGDARAWIYGNQIACNEGDPGDGIDILTDHVIVGADSAGIAHANEVGPNQRNGVTLTGAAATNNVIRNSYLGSNQNGVVITGSAQLNYVLTNTVNSNTNIGVWLGGGTYFNAVQANDIYNEGNTGVQVDGGAHDNDIGSYVMVSGNGNHIFNNAREGIYLSGTDTRYNAVRDNRIGVNGPNGHNGIVLDDNTHGNVIGDYLVPGSTATGSNIISGNGMNGVDILNGAHDNTLGGNYIGTNISGTGVLSNTLNGVSISDGAHDNTLNRNLIGGNGLDGVVIDGSTTSTNTLTLNVIGYYTGAANITPNGWDGLALSNGTFGNIIGGTDSPNFIETNTASGIYVNGGSHHNSILPNAIAGNLKYGVILDGATTANNIISGTVIAYNLLDGLAERSDAVYNTWTHISVYSNGGLGINTQAVNESTHIPHPPFLMIVGMDRSSGLISGKANVTGGLFATKVELYRPALDPGGYGGGQTFVGSTFTDSYGNWSITDPAFTGCYTGFTTETTVLGTGSTEFIRNNCLTFLPLVLKN